jgi:hypothetical protein
MHIKFAGNVQQSWVARRASGLHLVDRRESLTGIKLADAPPVTRGLGGWRSATGRIVK